MNAPAATTQLALLTQRARAAGGDAAALNEVLTQVQAIAGDESLTPSRALAGTLIDAASALVGSGPPVQVEDLFGQAQRVVTASSDARIDDQLALWHNLGARFERHGAAHLWMQTLALELEVGRRRVDGEAVYV